MPILGQKNIFFKTNNKNGQKVRWKSAPLILKCIFYENKIYFFAKILWFLRFSQIQLPGGKIWDWYIIFQNFSDFLTPMLTLGLCVNIEMGNLSRFHISYQNSEISWQKIGQIWLTFDLEKWLWKYEIGIFCQVISEFW